MHVIYYIVYCIYSMYYYIAYCTLNKGYIYLLFYLYVASSSAVHSARTDIQKYDNCPDMICTRSDLKLPIVQTVIHHIHSHISVQIDLSDHRGSIN